MTDGDLAHELTLQVLGVRMTFRQTIQRTLRCNQVDMTFEMLQIMHRLWTRQGVSQQYLARQTAKDKACLTNLINNLVKKGWVVRRGDENDRRHRLIYLTPAGEQVADKVKPLLTDIYDRVGSKMDPEEMQRCINCINKFNAIFEEI